MDWCWRLVWRLFSGRFWWPARRAHGRNTRNGFRRRFRRWFWNLSVEHEASYRYTAQTYTDGERLAGVLVLGRQGLAATYVERPGSYTVEFYKHLNQKIFLR